MKITRKEFNQISQLKFLDIQVCDFCHQLNILNLGWKPFGKFYCRTHEADYTVCRKLCYKVCLNIWGCQLYQAVKEPLPVLVKPNKSYDLASCYLCGKELKGQSKHSQIKNRNNPAFWGISTKFKTLCLACIKRKYYGKLVKEKRNTLNRYEKRGYE